MRSDKATQKLTVSTSAHHWTNPMNPVKSTDNFQRRQNPP